MQLYCPPPIKLEVVWIVAPAIKLLRPPTILEHLAPSIILLKPPPIKFKGNPIYVNIPPAKPLILLYAPPTITLQL